MIDQFHGLFSHRISQNICSDWHLNIPMASNEWKNIHRKAIKWNQPQHIAKSASRKILSRARTWQKFAMPVGLNSTYLCMHGLFEWYYTNIQFVYSWIKLRTSSNSHFLVYCYITCLPLESIIQLRLGYKSVSIHARIHSTYLKRNSIPTSGAYTLYIYKAAYNTRKYNCTLLITMEEIR